MNSKSLQLLKDAGYTGELDLKSLIIACGDKFKSLDKTETGWIVNNYEKGLEPEDAVSNLWREINK